VAKLLEQGTVYGNNDAFFVYVELYKDGTLVEDLPTKKVYNKQYTMNDNTLSIGE
jgi:hypothetical protein